MKKIVLNLFVSVLVFAAAAQMAFAHAHLVSSTPQANSMVAGPAISIDLKFTSRLDASRSSVALLYENGKLENLKASSIDGSELATHVNLAPGKYTIRWQALATDGHLTRGEIPFTVR